MAAPISAMTADLERAMAAHAVAATEGVDAAAEAMAKAARSVSSPEYGVAVRARTVEISGGKEVQVLVTGTDGPGKVLGGLPAARAEVARVMDRVAKEDGLDRRG